METCGCGSMARGRWRRWILCVGHREASTRKNKLGYMFQDEKKEGEKKKECSTWDSQVVPHPSTNHA